jgi:biotin carboxyl carrier protein
MSYFAKKEFMAKVLIKGQKEIDVDYQTNGEVYLNGDLFNHEVVEVKPNHYHVIKSGKAFEVEIVSTDKASKMVSLLVNGKKVEVTVKDKMDILLEKLGISNTTAKKANDLKAPMPGLIHEIKVSEGQEVHQGDPILILEAMKMENVLKSPGDGIIKAISVEKGQSVEKNQVLITFS